MVSDVCVPEICRQGSVCADAIEVATLRAPASQGHEQKLLTVRFRHGLAKSSFAGMAASAVPDTHYLRLTTRILRNKKITQHDVKRSCKRSALHQPIKGGLLTTSCDITPALDFAKEHRSEIPASPLNVLQASNSLCAPELPLREMRGW